MVWRYKFYTVGQIQVDSPTSLIEGLPWCVDQSYIIQYSTDLFFISVFYGIQIPKSVPYKSLKKCLPTYPFSSFSLKISSLYIFSVWSYDDYLISDVYTQFWYKWDKTTPRLVAIVNGDDEVTFGSKSFFLNDIYVGIFITTLSSLSFYFTSIVTRYICGGTFLDGGDKIIVEKHRWEKLM